MYYFHVGKVVDEDLVNCGLCPYVISIVEADFWEDEGCLSDLHMSEEIACTIGEETLEGLDELQESMFAYEDSSFTRDDVIKLMLQRGFVENKEFSEYMDEFD